MALDSSALLALLAELKLNNVTDRIRSAPETLYQELIDTEAIAFLVFSLAEEPPTTRDVGEMAESLNLTWARHRQDTV